MKKKIIAVLMVLMLVAVTLSAKSNSGLALGVDAGFGIDKIKRTSTTTVGNTKTEYVTRYKNIGPAFNLNVDYNFNEYWGVRASAGLGIIVKSSANNGDEYKQFTNSTNFCAFDFALDAKYTVHLSDNIKLSALAGVEMLTGYVYKDKDSTTVNDKTKNFQFGVNGAAELGYAVNKNLTIKGGCSVSYFFVNTAERLKPLSDSNKVRNSGFYIRPYAGVVYAF